MRIGIDARELSGRVTGAGRYLGGLLREWATVSSGGRHEFILYAAEPLALDLDSRRFATRTISGSGATWWEQVSLPRAIARDHLDLWFAPAYTAPLTIRLPIVVAIHDVSFAAHPEWFRVREGIRRRWLTRRSADRAQAVITISEFSKRELMAHFSIAAKKIHVVPPGVDTGRGARPAGTARLNTASNSCRVLFVGSIFSRRHVIDLIRAFAPIARAHPDAALDIVGDNRSHPREDISGAITREGLQAQVRWHKYASEEQLRELYAHARAFAFLSEYEGLGLTPLEALAAGVPPVLLDTAVARESCGEAAIYVPPGNLQRVTRALEAVLYDDAVRGRILAAAAGVLEKYDWPRAARDTLAVLELAATRGAL